MRWGLTCDKGQCQERISKNGKEVIEVCKFKPTIKQVEEHTQDSDSCHYYLQIAMGRLGIDFEGVIAQKNF